jgi:hypothetical protein
VRVSEGFGVVVGGQHVRWRGRGPLVSRREKNIIFDKIKNDENYSDSYPIKKIYSESNVNDLYIYY